MTLKDIVVHVDHGRACPDRIKAACELARTHGAHLAGLYVISPMYMSLYESVTDEAREKLEQAAKVIAQKAESTFREITGEYDLQTEWRCERGKLADTLDRHARYADLIVLGQDDPEEPGEYVPTGVVDSVVLAAGRPALLVPYIGASAPVGENILIAWNGKREAARAVSDAMPFMEKARRVCMLVVNPGTGPAGEDAIPAANIVANLKRHGITVEVEATRAFDIDIGSLLLSRAAAEHIDLIVMGAYGHSRLRESILGGVTKQMLKHMTVPVLMSH